MHVYDFFSFSHHTEDIGQPVGLTQTRMSQTKLSQPGESIQVLTQSHTKL